MTEAAMRRDWIVGVVICGAVFVVGAIHRPAKVEACAECEAAGGYQRCACCPEACCGKDLDRCCCRHAPHCTCPKDPTLR